MRRILLLLLVATPPSVAQGFDLAGLGLDNPAVAALPVPLELPVEGFLVAA